MWMPAHQFAHQMIDNAVEVEMPVFPSDLSIENHLEQQISQLVFQMRVILTFDGIGNFVGFLQRVRHDGLVRLLRIPWTAGIRIP